MIGMLALATAMMVQVPPAQEGPIVTGGSVSRGESEADRRLREAAAYAQPLPRGAPAEDYAFVAWCEAWVGGHVTLGESLEGIDAEDREIVRLGRLEQQDFRSALQAGQSRASAADRAAATAAVERVRGVWSPVLAQADATDRSRSFGLFLGLPGRCEHAARRVRDGITTPPATPEEVGIRYSDEPVADPA